MRIFFSALTSTVLAAGLSLASTSLHAESSCGQVAQWPGASWSAPTSGGWNAALLTKAQQISSEQGGDAAVMVVHRGQLIAHWGETNTPRLVQSVRKQLLSGLIGQEVAAGRLDLQASLQELGIDDEAPPLRPEQRQARVQDLLESRSGIFHSAHYEFGAWKRERAGLAGQNIAPGQLWVYNNWDFNALGSIFERASGTTIAQAFDERIAAPLGMQDFQPAHVEATGDGSFTAWVLEDRSVHPAYAFRISARDLARYGLLWLGCGDWNGTAVLPPSWIINSTRGRPISEGAPADGIQHYFGQFGWLWWVERGAQRSMHGMPEDLTYYYASGAGGHRLLVIPPLDLVIAHVVATPGGVDTISQLRRRFFGKPEVDREALSTLLTTIINAHPAR